QADNGAHFERKRAPVRGMQAVIIKAIRDVPKLDTLAADIVHCPANMSKVLEEFAGNVFIGRVFYGQLQGNGQHVETVHPHPARPIRLFDVASRGKRRAAVEDADIIQTEKAALKNVSSLGVFAIHPPGEVQQKFLKHSLEKSAVALAAALLLDLVDAPCRPRVDWRVGVA